MKKNPVIRFLPLKGYDLLIYAFFTVAQILLFLSVNWEVRFVSTDSRIMMIICSLGFQFFVLYVLHRWIKNAYNWIFLLLIGIWQSIIWLNVDSFRFETLDKWNVFGLNAWIPLLIVMQLFRIWKLNRSREELAIPIRKGSVFGASVTIVDLLCFLLSLFIIGGFPILHYWFFEQ